MNAQEKEMIQNELLALLKSKGMFNIVNNDENVDWHNFLEKTSRGQVKPTYNNHKIVFENAIKGNLQFNEFERVIEYNNVPLSNASMSILRNQFEQEGGFRNRDVTRDFLIQYSNEHNYNPIKDYLESLTWDGTKRVATMFIDWFNVKDNIINRKLAEKWLVSGVKRIYEPGCLIEGMIVLVGAQGVGKSTFIKRLGLSKYSVEAIVDLRNDKNCVETFNRAWIVNFDELKSIIKADSELAKAMLTRQTDTSRLAYREESETYDRHCIFIGATNDTAILKDYTDKVERRYWMMQCNQEDKRYIYDNFNEDVVNQLWAEAYYIYKSNPNYNISISDFTDEEMDMMYEAQRNFKSFNGDDLTNELIEILDAKYQFNKDGVFVSQDDFLSQALGKQDMWKSEHTKVGQIDIIPYSYISYYLQHTNNRRPDSYITAALSQNWCEKTRIDYGGRRLHCLVRKFFS